MTRNVQQLFDLTGKTALVTGGSILQWASGASRTSAAVWRCPRSGAFWWAPPPCSNAMAANRKCSSN